MRDSCGCQSKPSANITSPQQTNRCRVISNWTQPIVPVSIAVVSVARNFQVPAKVLPTNAESGDSGMKLPANGAAPAAMGVAAESSKIVAVPEQSLLPLP